LTAGGAAYFTPIRDSVGLRMRRADLAAVSRGVLAMMPALAKATERMQMYCILNEQIGVVQKEPPSGRSDELVRRLSSWRSCADHVAQ